MTKLGKLSPMLLGVVGVAGCLPANMDSAQNRCLNYGYQGQNALARCTEIEMSAPPGAPIGFSQINAAQSQCMVLGYRGNALADCTQRHVRSQVP